MQNYGTECHKCKKEIDFVKNDYMLYPVNMDLSVYFHKDCFNRYEHYYGLDKAID